MRLSVPVPAPETMEQMSFVKAESRPVVLTEPITAPPGDQTQQINIICSVSHNEWIVLKEQSFSVNISFNFGLFITQISEISSEDFKYSHMDNFWCFTSTVLMTVM